MFVGDTTNWADPGVGEEVVLALNYDNQNKVELVTYTDLLGPDSVFICERGADDTIAQQHQPGALVAHRGSAVDIENVANAVQPGDLALYQTRSEKGANNGYASLDAGGDVPLSQLGNVPASVQMATGTYTGDGAGSRTIALSFTPKFVVIGATGRPSYHFSNVGSSMIGGRLDGGGTLDDALSLNTGRPRLTTNGFIVDGAGSAQLNISAITYDYFAIG